MIFGLIGIIPVKKVIDLAIQFKWSFFKQCSNSGRGRFVTNYFLPCPAIFRASQPLKTMIEREKWDAWIAPLIGDELTEWINEDAPNRITHGARVEEILTRMVATALNNALVGVFRPGGWRMPEFQDATAPFESRRNGSLGRAHPAFMVCRNSYFGKRAGSIGAVTENAKWTQRMGDPYSEGERESVPFCPHAMDWENPDDQGVISMDSGNQPARSYGELTSDDPDLYEPGWMALGFEPRPFHLYEDNDERSLWNEVRNAHDGIEDLFLNGVYAMYGYDQSAFRNVPDFRYESSLANYGLDIDEEDFAGEWQELVKLESWRNI